MLSEIRSKNISQIYTQTNHPYQAISIHRNSKHLYIQIKASNYNPFLQALIPSLTQEQIPQIILMMAKQMEENNFRSFNINYLLAFITTHSKMIV